MRFSGAGNSTSWQAWKRYWHKKIGSPNSHEPRYLAEQYLAQAMQNPTSHAYQVSASIRAQRGQHEQAISDAERAIALDPNDADSYAAFAGVLNLAGQPQVALEIMERAIRLNPHYPAAYLYEIGLARFGSGDFEAAFEALDKAVAINPDDRWASRLLIATLGHLGRQQEAEQLMQKSEASWYGFDPLSVRGVTFWYPFKNQADTARLAEGLRKAGLPE